MLKSSIGMLCLLCKDTNNIQKTYWEFNPKSVIWPKQTCYKRITHDYLCERLLYVSDWRLFVIASCFKRKFKSVIHCVNVLQRSLVCIPIKAYSYCNKALIAIRTSLVWNLDNSFLKKVFSKKSVILHSFLEISLQSVENEWIVEDIDCM